MRLLIDGYNLLHATDLFGSGAQAGTLEGSREALLGYLAAHLPDKLRRSTTIVFDAAGAPPHLPDRQSYRLIRVRFARGFADADALLEQIIDRHRAPRSLLVISSDHRVQRAARQRGAKSEDSLPWFRGLAPSQPSSAERPVDMSAPELSAEYWKREFARQVEQANIPVDKLSANTAPSHSIDENRKPDKKFAKSSEVDGPFPPDYLASIEEELNDDL